MSETATVTKIKLKKPKLYKVVLLNDNFTPMEFVLYILQDIFGMNAKSSYDLMMKIHLDGKGVAGIYSKEIAETKANETIFIAKSANHPLKAIVEIT